MGFLSVMRHKFIAEIVYTLHIMAGSVCRVDINIEEWFHRHADDVYSFLSYYSGSLDVDDLVQDTFLRAMAKMDLYQGQASPKTWLCSIARNVAKDSFRKQRRHPAALETSVLMQIPSSEVSPEGVTELNETKQTLHPVIQRLQPNYRDVVILTGILDLSVSETSHHWFSPYKRYTRPKAVRSSLSCGSGTRLGGVVHVCLAQPFAAYIAIGCRPVTVQKHIELTSANSAI